MGRCCFGFKGGVKEDVLLVVLLEHAQPTFAVPACSWRRLRRRRNRIVGHLVREA